MIRQRSTAVPLALAYLLLVAYASLYPFEGWRWPAVETPLNLLALPWPKVYTAFDDWSNLLGYAPLGALLFASVSRSDGMTWKALAAGALAPALLSYALETAQSFVPGRVPSLRDWALNSVGAVVGAGLAQAARGLGLFERWQRVRERWFMRDGGPAIALILLWPLGLLFPTPVPLGLGQVFQEVRVIVEAAFAGTPWEANVQAWLGPLPAPSRAMSVGREAIAIGLGMLAPALLVFAASRPGWRRLAAAVGAALVGLGAMTLSSALNFGPDHALAWLTPRTLPAIGGATLLAVLLVPAPPRLCAALGLVALSALVTIVAEAPADPYYAASLQGWEQGRFIRFHGLAQWVGWLWPYLAMTWLVARLVRRD
jgi:VanZ family protein